MLVLPAKAFWVQRGGLVKTAFITREQGESRLDLEGQEGAVRRVRGYRAEFRAELVDTASTTALHGHFNLFKRSAIRNRARIPARRGVPCILEARCAE